MYINYESIITAAAVLAAAGAILGYLMRAQKWYLRQNRQNTEIAQLKAESNMLCQCMYACLDGLIQLGANHSVPAAREKMDEYLRNAAHRLGDGM